jgi:hypothetical protein
MKRSVIVRWDFVGKFNKLVGENIGHFENRNFIRKEGYYCVWW